jgi:hypothetical protein
MPDPAYVRPDWATKIPRFPRDHACPGRPVFKTGLRGAARDDKARREGGENPEVSAASGYDTWPAALHRYEFAPHSRDDTRGARRLLG